MEDEIGEMIVQLYENGETIRSVAKKMNIGSSTVYRELKRRGVNTDPKHRANTYYHDKYKSYNIDESFFEKIDTQEKAYILGLLYADGNLHNKRSQIKLKLQEPDKNILLEINDIMKNTKPPHFHKKKKSAHQNQLSIVITNTKMYNDLLHHGLYPNKTYDLKFPGFLEKNLIPHFIRGYFDGDGCISLYKSREKYFSKRENREKIYIKNRAELSIIGTSHFCESLKKYLESIHNITSGITNDVRSDDRIRRLRITKKSDIKRIYHIFYNNANIFLERKKSKFLEL